MCIATKRLLIHIQGNFHLGPGSDQYGQIAIFHAEMRYRYDLRAGKNKEYFFYKSEGRSEKCLRN